MLPCPVLDNDQVAALADMRELADVVESCFIAKAERRLVAPPRHAVNFVGGIDIRPAATAREAVDGAAIVICATSSEQPVIESAWLAPHVNALGAKASDRHEMPHDIGLRAAWTVTDSPDQVRATRPGFFLDGTPGDAMLDLADAVSGKSPIRRPASDVALFCSVGLAGTEVVIANALLRRAGRMA